MPQNNLSCPVCLTAFARGYECARCQRTYPVLGSVPVLHSHAESLIALWSQRIAARGTRVEDCARQSDAWSAARPRELARAQRILEAERHNHEVIEGAWRRATGRLALRDRGPSLAQQVLELSCDWPAELMIPYFFQDWGPVERIGDVVALATSALKEKPQPLLAVLGSGAGGLLHHVAPECCHAFGVDLSLPVLVLAADILAGGQLTFCATTPDTGEVAVRGPATAATNVTQLGGDVHQLPFADESLDVVVSQFLLDIVPSAERVAVEVNRVLRPGGLWANFGVPFRWPRDPEWYRPRTHDDVAECLADAGFGAVRAERRTFRFLDPGPSLPWAPRAEAAPVLFVAAKQRSIPSVNAEFAAHAGGRGSAILARRPRLTAGRSVRVMIEPAAPAGTGQGASILLVDGQRPTEIPAAIGAYYAQLVGAMEHGVSLAQLCQAFGPAARMSESEFVLFFRLLWQAGLVEMEP